MSSYARLPLRPAQALTTALVGTIALSVLSAFSACGGPPDRASTASPSKAQEQPAPSAAPSTTTPVPSPATRTAKPGQVATQTPPKTQALGQPETPTATAKPVVVELWHDVVCPWCRIGHAHLKSALKEFQGPVEIVYHPYLLNPDAPKTPQNLKARLGEKYGAERVDGMFDRVSKIGDGLGLTFTFNAQTRSYDSLPSHAMVDWAPAAKRGAILDRLHDAYFVANDDISKPKTLRAIAVAEGLDGDAAVAAAMDAKRQAKVKALATKRSGIRGVPYFKIGDHVLRGAQPAAKIVLALKSAQASMNGE